MEDSVSIKSNESLATSDEFDFICDKPGCSKTPTLNIASGDITEFANAMSEVLQEQEDNMSIINDTKLIGESKFYGIDESTSTQTSPIEKQDAMKPDFSDEEDVDQDCTIFSGVTYLGAAAINAPKSETEIQRNMAILNEQSSETGIKVSVSVPCSSQGIVVLYDANTNSVIARYEIHRILFYARGAIESSEASCFSFTWSHGDTQESAIFQCHVFRCDISEAVTRVSACFSKAFQRNISRSMTSSITSAVDMSSSLTTLSEARRTMFVFEVTMEIKEDEGKGSFSTVAKDRSGFKLRADLEKQICLNIRQVCDTGPLLFIERCFGVLVAPGHHVKHSDMQLLEMVQMDPSNNFERNCSSILASWDPTEAVFESLNVETPKDQQQPMSVALDLVIRGIQEPVRFQIETSVKILNQNERFWYFQRRCLTQQFFVHLKEILNDGSDILYEVLSMDTSGEIDRNRLNLALNLTSLKQSPSITSIDTITPKDEYLSDGDEPLLSGTGLVSKDCSEDVLENWADVLAKWKSTNQRPKQLSSLVKLGIPEALRGEVWQRLAGTEENRHMMEKYRILITKESSCETVIQRDIARTFPAHDFFKEAGGIGQDSLYRVSKAYAVYDDEVGYCQGLSFLAATLLLHMPEEQAFCVLVKLMYDYGLRDLYKDGFDNLYLRLYQLNKLMEEQLTALYQHFTEHHVETHMFASQWFLTLFTARFPLFFVFHIIDVFLLQGIETLFQIALALLMMCKKDLMTLDFEGILKYFRISLPKKVRTEESAKRLIKYACSIKVKKLKRYEADFIALKEADCMENNVNEVEQLRLIIARQDEERKLMMDEIVQLKEMLKREVSQAEQDSKTKNSIIQEYKIVRQRLDSQLTAVKAELDLIQSKISKCENCSTLLDNNGGNSRKPDLILDDQALSIDRVRELELQLAKAKLAQVEAECKNQDLTHQLRSTENELSSAKNSWPPWLAKTLTSIKEVAHKKDFSSFTYQSNIPNAPTFISHISNIRRDSVPSNASNYDPFDIHRDTSLLKDSQSCSSLRTQH